MTSLRDRVRQLAQESHAQGDPVAWFERLYHEANADADRIPWADRVANPSLTDWLDAHMGTGDAAPRTALVVGCGLGDDAEALSARGINVTAFDVSPTAVAWCAKRFPDSDVTYTVADALDLPQTWRGAFDLVVEIYTLQVLPQPSRARALDQLAATVAPGGRLLIICRGRDQDAPTGAMPWPLTRAELDAVGGLTPATLEEFLDHEDPPVRRFRAVYQKQDEKTGVIS